MCDCRPFERYSFEKVVGIMLLRIALRGGGDERYGACVEELGVEGSDVAKQRVGTGKEITDPKKAILVIQRGDNRGSKEILDEDQYLRYV